jgi:hypothetical protein
MGDCLRHSDDRLAQPFFRAASSVIDPAWDMAVGSDLALTEVPGPRRLLLPVSNAQAEQVLPAVEHDAIVAGVFSEVNDLLAAPGQLMPPEVSAGCCAASGNLSRARHPAAA